MKSSAGIAGRALIMLACVIGIPIIAMSGTSWPEIVKKLQDLRLPTIPASTSTPADDAQRIASVGGRDSSGFPASTSTGPASQPPAGPLGQRATPSNSGVVPADYQAPADLRPGDSSPAAALAHSDLSLTSPGADPFHAVQERLKEMGATYYLLESWGNQQQMFRFYCRMAVGGNPNYTHYFEAIESDPLQAMVRVLRQVEAQHQGGIAASR